MKYLVKVSETRNGEVVVDAATKEEAETIASGKEIDYFDSEVHMVAELAEMPLEHYNYRAILYNKEGTAVMESLYVRDLASAVRCATNLWWDEVQDIHTGNKVWDNFWKHLPLGEKET